MLAISPNPKRIISFFFLVFVIFNLSCSDKNVKLKEGDFTKFTKIDSHVHVNTGSKAFLDQAVTDNYKLLTINTDVPYYPPIQKQEKFALEQVRNYPNQIHYVTSFSLDGWEKPDWAEKTISALRESLAKGAVAVKVWKNIGMDFKDESGNMVMIDNPQFDPVFKFLASEKIPVLGHLGEPKNCWLPADEMTVNNDKEYFKDHPQYHMYLHPELPTYEDQIRARDHMLEKHPDLVFVGAHLGSLEWSVDEIAAHLDRFPNMAVDMAARVCHLQYQSLQDRAKVRDFIIKYQDRLLYATDLQTDGTESPDSLKLKLHNTWHADWNYFATDEWMNVPEVNGKFQGLLLPREVLEKIYHKNAEQWFSLAN